MAKLQLPFWLVTEQEHLLNRPPPKPHFPLAFTSIGKAFAFMGSHGAGRWELSEVADQDGLILAIGDLHHQQTSRLLIDPQPDGTRGTLVGIADLLLTGVRPLKAAPTEIVTA